MRQIQKICLTVYQIYLAALVGSFTWLSAGRTRAKGKNLAQCDLYGLATGDLPWISVVDIRLRLDAKNKKNQGFASPCPWLFKSPLVIVMSREPFFFS